MLSPGLCPFLKFVQKVSVHCISMSNRLIDFQDEKSSSETTRPGVLIFGMYYHLVDLYQVCSNYAPGVKDNPAPGFTCNT